MESNTSNCDQQRPSCNNRNILKDNSATSVDPSIHESFEQRNGRSNQIHPKAQGSQSARYRWDIRYANRSPHPRPSNRILNHISPGIGYGVAEALIENGATVSISSSSQSKIDSSIASIKSAYPSIPADRISGFACNLGDATSLEANLKGLFDHVTDNNTHKLDHIVYTAGDALAMMPIASATLDKMLQAGMVRFFGPMLVGKLAPAYMSAGPASSLTLTTGSVSEKPRPNWVVVNSYATGLQGMCRGLALDLKPIRVNLVSPGAVQTELWATVGITGEAAEKMFKGLAEAMPTGSVGQVVDVVEPFLCAIKDRNMTGQMISSNGGAMLI